MKGKPTQARVSSQAAGHVSYFLLILCVSQLCLSSVVMQAAREMAETMTRTIGREVYTFSVFHVFFEQYITIGRASILVLGDCSSIHTLSA